MRPDERKGWKTTEFWLSVVASMLGVLMASGLLEPDSTWAKIVGVVVTALSASGYGWSRARVKASSSGAAAAAAALEAVRIKNGNPQA